MLLNLSNHPISTWPEKQIDTAIKIYSEIRDIKFPQIDPEATENEIVKLACEYLKICTEKLNRHTNQNNAVHLMGELTFVLALSKMLIEKKIKVIASTTKRNSIETNSGKFSKFEFVQFRNFI